MKRVLVLFLAMMCILTVIPGCASTKKEQSFHDLVEDTQVLLDDVADDIYSNWYDCIYDDKFSGDINLAIASAIADNEDKLNEIEGNNAVIESLYSKIKDSKYKSEVKAVMQAYNDYYALVIEVSGSFNSYSANKEAYKKELSSALKDLEMEISGALHILRSVRV